MTKSPSNPSCSLWPEFDEANAAAMKESEAMIVLNPEVRNGTPQVVNHAHGGWGGGSGYGGGGNYTGTNNYYTPTPKCTHVGDKVVFEAGGKKLYAANFDGLDEYSGKWDLIIDLVGAVRIKKSHFVAEGYTKRFHELRPLEYTYPNVKSEVLRLDWADMQPPPVPLEFWLALWEMLPEKTVVVCHGGHGRTGTCIASLMIASGVDYYSAVPDVREIHCKKAIETLSQEEYLHEIYVDDLNRRIKDETSPAELAELEQDLAFATSHKPTAASWDGKPVKSTTIAMTDSTVITEADLWNAELPLATQQEESEGWRRVAGIDYVKECVDLKCRIRDCDLPAHQAWVEWHDVYVK